MNRLIETGSDASEVLEIGGNPGWSDDESGDTTLTLQPMVHGGSCASLTLVCWPHSADIEAEVVEVGVELTPDDLDNLIKALRQMPRQTEVQ